MKFATDIFSKEELLVLMSAGKDEANALLESACSSGNEKESNGAILVCRFMAINILATDAFNTTRGGHDGMKLLDRAHELIVKEYEKLLKTFKEKPEEFMQVLTGSKTETQGSNGIH